MCDHITPVSPILQLLLLQINPQFQPSLLWQTVTFLSGRCLPLPSHLRLPTEILTAPSGKVNCQWMDRSGRGCLGWHQISKSCFKHSYSLTDIITAPIASWDGWKKRDGESVSSRNISTVWFWARNPSGWALDGTLQLQIFATKTIDS